jgi:hypothetical protein
MYEDRWDDKYIGPNSKIYKKNDTLNEKRILCGLMRKDKSEEVLSNFRTFFFVSVKMFPLIISTYNWPQYSFNAV